MDVQQRFSLTGPHATEIKFVHVPLDPPFHFQMDMHAIFRNDRTADTRVRLVHLRAPVTLLLDMRERP